jgi:hypothetical protein
MYLVLLLSWLIGFTSACVAIGSIAMVDWNPAKKATSKKTKAPGQTEPGQTEPGQTKPGQTEPGQTEPGP